MTTKIYLAMTHGLAVIIGRGGSWRGDVKLQDQKMQCVAADTERPAVVYGGSFGQGVFRSTDAGVNWSQCDGTADQKLMALAATGNAFGSGRVYAGTEPSSILRSDDQGETWRRMPSFLDLPSARQWSFPPRPETHHVRCMLPDPHVPRRLHVAIEAGALLCSEDDGETWRDRVPSAPRDTHTLAGHPKAAGRLYSAAGDGYFESRDDGDKWQRVEDGLEHRYCWSVAVSAGDPDTILLAASRNAGDAHAMNSANSFVYRRAHVQSWRRAENGLPDLRGRRIATVSASPLKPEMFYLASEGELYWTQDGGEHWQPLAVEWADNARPQHALGMAVLESEDGMI
jgi:photosystem II stability/assembly factor-like uncharacterized protein